MPHTTTKVVLLLLNFFSRLFSFPFHSLLGSFFPVSFVFFIRSLVAFQSFFMFLSIIVSRSLLCCAVRVFRSIFKVLEDLKLYK